MSFDLAAVPGVAETDLPADLLSRLPANLAPAPWQVKADAIVWWAPAGEAAQAALPSELRSRAKAVMVVGGLVRYDETPVGTYDEVFGVIGYRLGARIAGNVAFMAVDSPTSLVGGRTNWSMPKTLATFDGDLADGQTISAKSDTGAGWAVSATPRLRGPRIPFMSRSRAIQQFPDGTLRGSRMSLRGRIRPGRIDVNVESPGSLPEWLPSGTFRGGMISPMNFGLGEPTKQ